MQTTYNILLSDDHPGTNAGHRYILNLFAKENNLKFEIEEAKTLSESKEKLNPDTDFILLDLQFETSDDSEMISGEDFALYIREHYPNTGIFIISSYSDNIRINSIKNQINPEAIISKTEFDYDIAKEALEAYFKNEKYYSPQVKIKFNTILNEGDSLDLYNRQILSYLARGMRTEDIPDKIPISLSAIEKRKKKIKVNNGFTKRGDAELIELARKLGL